MKKNIGKADKIVRVVLGLAIGAAGVYFKNWFGLIGIVPLVTVFLGTCPAYLPFGITTCRANKS